MGYRTEDFTALNEDTPENDYVHAMGMLVFAPGETVKSFEIIIQGDTRQEDPIELLGVDLFDPQNASLGGPQSALVYIMDDDYTDYVNLSLIHFEVPNIRAAEDVEEGTVTFVLYRSGDTSSFVTVEWMTHYGTASDTDIVDTSGTVLFAPYEQRKVVAADLITDDVVVEGDETFTITLGSSLDTTRTGPNPLVVTILDDDRLTEQLKSVLRRHGIHPH